MHDPESPLAIALNSLFDDDDIFDEPTDEELLEEETGLEEDLEPVDDEGFDISEFDEDDEGSLYGDDDELYIAGDEDLPDDPDDDDGNDDDDDEDPASDLGDEVGWFPLSLN